MSLGLYRAWIVLSILALILGTILVTVFVLDRSRPLVALIAGVLVAAAGIWSGRSAVVRLRKLPREWRETISSDAHAVFRSLHWANLVLGPLVAILGGVLSVVFLVDRSQPPVVLIAGLVFLLAGTVGTVMGAMQVSRSRR